MFHFPIALVIAPTLLMVVTVLLMLRRGLHRKLPVFFAYLSYQCIWAVLLTGFAGRSNYASLYWFGDALSMVLGFAVISELFESVLKEYEGVRDLGLLLYKWAAVGLMVIAVISCASATGGEAPPFIIALLTLERGVRFVQCGLFLFLFFFSACLGLSWRNHAFGFALGYAIFVISDLVIVAARWHAGAVGQRMYFWLTPLSFDVAVIVWFIYALQPEIQDSPLVSVTNRQVADWNATVLQLLRREWS